ncbi:MAG TPA: zf-HC2 domain-containing protein [Acidimicrobiales bacterium]|jgi:anti-sigma factor (TIGR02949 family)
MKPLISCREAVRELWRYLDEELKAVDHERVEEHLDHCVHCCGELEFVRQMQKLLGSQQELDLPADVQQRLEGLIDELTHPGRSGK